MQPVELPRGRPPVEHASSPVSPPNLRRPTLSTVIASVLAAALLILAAILVLNHGTLVPNGPSGPTSDPVLVFVDGIHRIITYDGGAPEFLGPAGVNDSCAYCPVGAQAGGALRIPLAIWSPPANLSFWIFTNVSGPFPVLAPSCSPAPCTIPWISVWSFQTFVSAGTLQTMVLFATFLLPSQPEGSPNIVDLNATLCPVSVCPAPAP